MIWSATKHLPCDVHMVDVLGLIPSFLAVEDPRTAREQIDAYYGWRPIEGFILESDFALSFPGDPPMDPLVETTLRDERIFVYQSGWVAIVQPDLSFTVARLD